MARPSIGPRHTTGSLSGRKKPMRTFFTPCASGGSILPSCVSGGIAGRPIMRGTVGPYTSASMRATARPREASAVARFTVTVLLPTPPFPLATAIVRVREPGPKSDWTSWSRCLRRPASVSRSSQDIASSFISTARPSAIALRACSASARIWLRRGHPAVVSTIVAPRCVSSATTSRTMPRSTMSRCSSGSLTLERARSTSSWVTLASVIESLVGVGVSCVPARGRRSRPAPS